MIVGEIVARRGISEVLHFTTNAGLVGILATGALKSRKRLPSTKYLEHVYSPNCAVRFDPEWIDYVNLSITRINSRLFDISSQKWHKDEDLWWCVLSFSPEIMEHDGVYFATTNNAYEGCERAPGPAGLERLFADTLRCWPSGNVDRPSGIPDSWPTCFQAEVLYPGDLSTDHLKRVYVINDLHHDIATAQIETVTDQAIDVAERADVFQ